MTKTDPLTPWEVLASRVDFHDRWLTLRTDRCRMPSGQILEGYHVVELSDWLNVVAVTRELDVLVLREYRHGAGKVVRGLPAGMLETTDVSPTEAARRELGEETGYTGGEFFSLGSAFANPAIQNNRVHSFLAVDVVRTGEQKLDPTEAIEIFREPYAEFVRNALTRKIDFQCIHLAGVHDALMFILSAGASEAASAALKRLRGITLETLTSGTSGTSGG